jgi:predicted XRE-type DNA-binding protein
MVKKIAFEVGSDNVFRDLGFSEAEAEEAMAKARLIHAIGKTVTRRKLTQAAAARICQTDQPTLSRVLRGRMDSITIDKLAAWLTALGHNIEIRIGVPRRTKAGHLLVKAA